jgi:16S rRNA processing protein RimM
VNEGLMSDEAPKKKWSRPRGPRPEPAPKAKAPAPARAPSVPDVPPGFVELGRLTRPHGVRGEIRLHLHWEESTTLDDVKTVSLFRGGKSLGEYPLEAARHADKAVLVRLRGVDDRSIAETLRGAAVCVPRELLPPLEPGEYYLSDLIGARVVSPEGPVGEVVEIRMHPSVDSVVIRKPDGELVEQPLSEPWVAAVDAEAKLLELTSTDGLF